MTTTPNSPTFRTDERIHHVKRVYCTCTSIKPWVYLVLGKGEAEERLSLSLGKMLVIHEIPKIPVTLDTRKTLEIFKFLHTHKIHDPLKGVAIHNILEPLNTVEVCKILDTLKVLEIPNILLQHGMPRYFKTLDLRQIRHQLNLPFSVIQDYTKDMKSLAIKGLNNFQQLKALLPHFPNRMPELYHLDISCDLENVIWDPPSDDPFDKFPNTLKELSLTRIPLQSFSTINTLTEFCLSDPSFAYPVDFLLGFLKKNTFLQRINIHIRFKHPDDRYSKAQVPIYLGQLRSLAVYCGDPRDAEGLVTYVPLQTEDFRLLTIIRKTSMQLKDIFSFSKCIITSPVEMRMDFSTIAPCISLSRPGRMLNIYPVSNSEMTSVLTGEAGLSLENMTELSLKQPHLLLVNLASCKFPALKTLIIAEDMELLTLFQLFSFEDPPMLDSLRIHDCILPKHSSDFIEALKRFASSNGMVLGSAEISPGYKVSASFERDRASPSLSVKTPTAEGGGRMATWVGKITVCEETFKDSMKELERVAVRNHIVLLKDAKCGRHALVASRADLSEGTKVAKQADVFELIAIAVGLIPKVI